MMKRILALAALLALAAAPAHAQMSRFLGNWDAADESGQVARVLITMEGTTLKVHLWGRCGHGYCDWGEQPGAAFADRPDHDPFDTAEGILTEYWIPEERSRVVIRPAGDDRIEIEVYTQFTDSSGRNSYRLHNLLRRSPAP
jgi:hypothetical protein